MIPSCPQLRRDLVFSRNDGTSAGGFVIKDPRANRFFRFREAEGFVASQLDGDTPLEEVSRRTEKEFGAALPISSLQSFLLSLNTLGLLESSSPPGNAAAPRRSRIQGSLLYLRWKALDPDPLFERLIQSLRWIFTPTFVLFCVMLMTLSMGITIANYGAIGRRLPELFRTDILVLVWLVLLGVIVSHEFAHGLTCKYFGGHVHELGFMLIFFQPAMYCNVSDAWLFPELRKRLWVTFAGSFFEMFLWSMATLIWWISDPNTLLNLLALVVMLTSGIKTLFNLNPLIKLDGYYLLSDWLNIPNLNRRASQSIRSYMARLLRLQSASSFSRSSRRERRILLVYGALAFVFSYGLLTWLLFQVGEFLTVRYQGAGFVATMGLLVAFFHRPLLSRSTSPMDSDSAMDSPKRARRWPCYTFFLVLTFVALFFVPMELTVSAPFTIQPARYSDVRAATEGIIEEVLVHEDESVAAGQVLARLSDSAWRTELDKVTADLAAATARLHLLMKGPRSEEIDLARRESETAQVRWQRAQHQLETNLRIQDQRLARSQASIEKSQTQLDGARAEMERVRQLVANGAGAPKELQDAESVVAVREKEVAEMQGDLRVVSADDLIHDRQAAVVAEMEMQEAQSRLALLQAGSRAELVDAARAECSRLEAHRLYCQMQMKHLAIVSPVSGVIVTQRIREKTGQRVDKGDLFASVHDLSRVRAEINVPEKEIADLGVGHQVTLKVRAHPRESFHGTISSIAPITSVRDDLVAGRAILVAAEFSNPQGLLKSEMTGQCKIYCGKRSMIDVLTRRLLAYIRVEFWTWW